VSCINPTYPTTGTRFGGGGGSGSVKIRVTELDMTTVHRMRICKDELSVRESGAQAWGGG